MSKYKEFKDYIVTQPPVNQVLTLAETKDYLKIDSIDEDIYIQQLIDTATDCFEKYTGRTLINTTYKAFLDKFPPYDQDIKIKRSRFQSLISLQYYKNKTLTTLDPILYFITESNDFSLITLYNNSNYPIADCRKQAIQINFIAGYGANSSDIPQAIKRALLSHIAYLYNNAGDCMDDLSDSDKQFKELYMKYKISNYSFSVL